MVVQHNLQAMNANRMLGVTAKSAASSTEKLSSGYRINRAADDAAGLAISEKMRKQIRGLDRASLNAEDGISSVQTAEGALTEVHDMLQRMNELCVQAANGTNSESDRQAIQNELDQLVTEIDRVAETTKFNDTYLLKGDEVKTTSKQYTVNYSIDKTANIVSNDVSNELALRNKVNYTGTNNVYMVKSEILDTNSSVALTAKNVGTGDDITEFMIKDAYKKEYSYATKYDPNHLEEKYLVDVTYKNDPITSSRLAIKTGVSKINGKDIYATNANATTNLDATFLANNVDISINDDNTITLKWKTNSQFYSDPNTDPIADPVNAQSKLITNADLQAAYDNGDFYVYSPDGFYKTSATTDVKPLTEDELKAYFDETTQGFYNSGVGNPVYRWNENPAGSGIYVKTAVNAGEVGTYVTIAKTRVTNGLYTDAAHANLLDSADWSTVFNDDGTLINPLHAYNEDGSDLLVDNSNIGDFIDISYTLVRDDTKIPDNNSAAAFNKNDYVAFVSAELNSNLGIGNNGAVDSVIDTTSTYDLSTDGTSDIVRANKDLYIYNKETQTMTHVNVGEEMTDYLTDDRTMKDKYVFMDILDSVNGTSDRIKKEILGGVAVADFVWDNNYITDDKSMQVLYDSNGKEVSGMALNKYFDNHGKYMGGLYSTSQARAIDQVFAASATGTEEYNNIVNYLGGEQPKVIDDYITISSKEVSGDLDFKLHVGADGNEENKIDVNIKSLTAAGLGIDKIHSSLVGIVDSTGANATAAIDVIAEAIQKVSTQRSNLGAIQNRLEHTIKNLDNVAENTQAAESQIRDTDMATEMVRHSNTNVLQQAGQSMLAQANQANQGVLSLLQ